MSTVRQGVDRDSSSSVKLAARRELDQLLKLIEAKHFSGTVVVTVYARDGKVTNARSSINRDIEAA